MYVYTYIYMYSYMYQVVLLIGCALAAELCDEESLFEPLL